MFNPYATYTATEAQAKLDALIPAFENLTSGAGKAEVADPHGGRVVYTKADVPELKGLIIRLQQAVGICPTGRRIGIDLV